MIRSERSYCTSALCRHALSQHRVDETVGLKFSLRAWTVSLRGLHTIALSDVGQLGLHRAAELAAAVARACQQQPARHCNSESLLVVTDSARFEQISRERAQCNN